MEMITEHDNYEHLAWSVGVRLRGNLDSIHTWAEQFGLGNDFKKVSAKLSEGRSSEIEISSFHQKFVFCRSYKSKESCRFSRNT